MHFTNILILALASLVAVGPVLERSMPLEAEALAELNARGVETYNLCVRTFSLRGSLA